MRKDDINIGLIAIKDGYLFIDSYPQGISESHQCVNFNNIIKVYTEDHLNVFPK